MKILFIGLRIDIRRNTVINSKSTETALNKSFGPNAFVRKFKIKSPLQLCNRLMNADKSVATTTHSRITTISVGVINRVLIGNEVVISKRIIQSHFSDANNFVILNLNIVIKLEHLGRTPKIFWQKNINITKSNFARHGRTIRFYRKT